MFCFVVCLLLFVCFSCFSCVFCLLSLIILFFVFCCFVLVVVCVCVCVCVGGGVTCCSSMKRQGASLTTSPKNVMLFFYHLHLSLKRRGILYTSTGSNKIRGICLLHTTTLCDKSCVYVCVCVYV